MSLAITEKRQQQQHRGCAGVFFQLWEWNRRLARRKLFFRKLLPPARPAKKASEVFGMDDKMPVAKLLLIAEENMGGFPIAKKPEPDAGQGDGSRAPGLVARLMGLESMPVSPETPDDAVECTVPLCRTACGKVESRPPKLQKTAEGLPERQTIERAAEQTSPSGNNVLVKSRPGNKHQKLGSSPAKSPRLLAGRPRARLMQAATKILDPRMQSRNGARCGIGYVESSAADADANHDAIATGKSEELLDDSVLKSSMKSDGFDGKSPSGMHKKETFRSSDRSSCNSVSKISSGRISSCPQTGISSQNKQSEFAERRQLVGNNQNQSKHRPHSASRNNLKQTQTAAVRDKVAFGSKVCIRKLIVKSENEPIARRSYVPMERSLNNPAGIGLTCGVTDMQKASTEKNLVRKRAISGSHNENFPGVNSALVKEESFGSCSINGKGQVFTGHQVMNKKSTRNVSRNRVHGDCSSGTGTSISSLAFRSPIRHSTRPLLCDTMTERARGAHELHHDVSLKRPSMDMKNNNMPSKRRIQSTANDQSTVLEKKKGDVTFVGWNELRTRNTLTAASILQELIAALIAGDPIPGQNGTEAGCSSEIVNSSSHCQDLFNFSILRSQVLNVKNDSQKESKFGSSGPFSHTKNDHPSPISILEASFSNDSCSYRSLDASSEGKPADSWSTSESSVVDPDTLDSATSVDNWKSDLKMFSYSSKRHCRFSAHSCEDGQSKRELDVAAQAVSNAATLLENFILTGSDGIKEEFSLESFLRDMLGVILDVTQPERTCCYKEARAAHMFKQCLFDCIIQCLDSKYRFFCRSGYNNWSKLYPFLTLEQLRREVHEQIRGWVDLAGKFSAELMENEMDNSTGRWADCGDEAFEAGKEIAGDILEALVSDMVLDFRLSFIRKYKPFKFNCAVASEQLLN